MGKNSPCGESVGDSMARYGRGASAGCGGKLTFFKKAQMGRGRAHFSGKRGEKGRRALFGKCK